MVMLHLFRQLDYKIEVAHINHSTRNGASDSDMAFVNAYCRQNSIPFHSKTLNYEELNKGNFQENARKERFDFLLELKEMQHCKWIATAHHKDDRWETFLMHLNRKSGIQGLTSLRAKENMVIHPLLIFTKKQIIEYADQNEIKYVYDKSNDALTYDRNAIRHKVTPEIVNLFPDFIENVNQSITHLEQTSSLLKELIDRSDFVNKDNKTGYFIISLKRIKAFENDKELLYHIIESFGFNYSNAQDMLEHSNTGALFTSDRYEGLLDRERLIIRLKRNVKKTQLMIDSPGSFNLSNGKTLEVNLNKAENAEKHLWLDKEKLNWPLQVRNIRPGDKFKPLGMKGATKTIKKLCTDLKIDRFTKEEMLVVCQDDIIIQIIGIRSHFGYITDDIKNAVTFNIVD